MYYSTKKSNKKYIQNKGNNMDRLDRYLCINLGILLKSQLLCYDRDNSLQILIGLQAVVGFHQRMQVLFPLQVAGIPGTGILSSTNSQSSFTNNLLSPGLFLQGRTKKGRKEEKLLDLQDFKKICVIRSRKESTTV